MPEQKRWVMIAQSGDTLDDAGREIQEEILYWSQDHGWVSDLSLATILDDADKELTSPPDHGFWLDITKETS